VNYEITIPPANAETIAGLKILRDASRLKELKAKLKGGIPSEAPFPFMWREAAKKAAEAEAFRKSGDTEKATASYQEYIAQVTSLLTLALQKEEADTAKGAMMQTKKKAGAALSGKPENVFYQAADRQAGDGEKAYGKYQFSRAGRHYRAAERLFQESSSGASPADRVKGFRRLVQKAKAEADRASARTLAPELYRQARESEAKARLHLTNKRFREAMLAFSESTDLYERARDEADEKKPRKAPAARGTMP
jgi:hypothetical protein